MISMNLALLRKSSGLTQEELAEKLNVSRQAVAKWENGESVPDLGSCIALSELFHVTLDDLIHYRDQGSGIPVPPKGKHLFGSVKVGERGQIVIPKKARDMFHINSGDSVLVLGDEDRGLALIPSDYLKFFFDSAAFTAKMPNPDYEPDTGKEENGHDKS